MKATAGDRLVVHAHHVGDRPRDAEIVEVLGEDGGPPYRVVWQDTGGEAIFFPSSDAHVEHFQKAAGGRTKHRPR